MVEELFSAMQNRNVEESYHEFALEQIDNALVRDLYMGCIGEAFEGYGEKSSIQENDQLNDFMNEGISTEDLVNEGENCANCKIDKECCDPAIIKAIDLLPESDPRDAGTFFSQTDAVSAECNKACQEQFDLIDAIIPDTIISL